jgi:hypothetical protein
MKPMTRVAIDPADLDLPPCQLPRAGEFVIWYSDSSPCFGILVGHDAAGRPVVKNEHGLTTALRSFDQLRLHDASRRADPSWMWMGEAARIHRPLPRETETFQALLGRRMPPGPSYIELIGEIYHRGFETFCVGGMVRDVIAGQPAHDVDLVTAMPLERSVPLLRSMYRVEPRINRLRGFVRLGGSPSSGDPYIDLKTMVHSQPGTWDAVFAANLMQDVLHRDFACNAIYYDPINNALIDPSGCGVEGAMAKSLELVADPNRPAYYRAQICIRYFKFFCRGYRATERTHALLCERYFPALAVMKRAGLVSYLRAQLLNKASDGDHHRVMAMLKDAMHACGAGLLWNDHIQPIIGEIVPEASL